MQSELALLLAQLLLSSGNVDDDDDAPLDLARSLNWGQPRLGLAASVTALQHFKLYVLYSYI